MRAKLAETITDVSISAGTVSAASPADGADVPARRRARSRRSPPRSARSPRAPRHAGPHRRVSRRLGRRGRRAAGVSAPTATRRPPTRHARSPCRASTPPTRPPRRCARSPEPRPRSRPRSRTCRRARRRSGGIVDTITGLAEQTDLLALNPAHVAATPTSSHWRRRRGSPQARRGSQAAAAAVPGPDRRDPARDRQGRPGRRRQRQAPGRGRQHRRRGPRRVRARRHLRRAHVRARRRDRRVGPADLQAEAAQMQGDIVQVADVAQSSSASAEQVSTSRSRPARQPRDPPRRQELATTAEDLERLVGRLERAILTNLRGRPYGRLVPLGVRTVVELLQLDLGTRSAILAVADATRAVPTIGAIAVRMPCARSTSMPTATAASRFVAYGASARRPRRAPRGGRSSALVARGSTPPPSPSSWS